MAIEKCPHCFSKVLPTNERTCPSCGENVEQLPVDERAGRELLWIGKATTLPPICVQCGLQTDEFVSLQEASTSRASAFFGLLFRIPPKLDLAILSLFRPDLAVQDGYRMLRKIPCCGRCRVSNRPRIHKTDHQHFRIGVLVRKEIAEQIQKPG